MRFDQLDGYIWYNGSMVAAPEAKLHVLSHGLHYASLVFEGLRAYGGNIFKLEEHTARLFNSAQLLDFTIPYSEEVINESCRKVLEVLGADNAYIRPFAWRGSEQMEIDGTQNTIHVAIAAWEWSNLFGEKKRNGIRLDVSDWRRPDPRTAPHQSKAAGLYMICTLAKHQAKLKGYDDALMLDYRGLIAEATGANIFFTKGNEVHTPIADCFLNGITRKTIIELVTNRQMTLQERPIRFDELEEFTGCFLTGTAAEVTIVNEISHFVFRDNSIANMLLDDYEKHVNMHPIQS